MKKVVFMLLSLGAFLVNANATCQVSMPPWKFAPPPAYCWDILAVRSSEHPGWDDVRYRSSTTYNHGGDIIDVKMDVYGYNSHTEAEAGYQKMSLVAKQQIVQKYTNILVGHRYIYRRFFNSAESGLIRATQYSRVKDSVYFK